MDFIPLAVRSFDMSFALYMGGMVVVGLVILGFGLDPKRGKKALENALVAVGSVGLVVSLASVPVALSEYNETQAKRAEHRQTVADGFTEHYGVEVTAEDVKELGYPVREPSEETVAGTTTLGSGVKVTLVVNEGKARLYKLGEELPVAD